MYYSLAEAGGAWNLSVIEILEVAMAGKLGLAIPALTWSGRFVGLREIEIYLNCIYEELTPKFQLRVPAPEFERYSAELAATKQARPKIPRKTNTIQTRQAWQLRINELATEHPEKSHANLCRLLAKETGDDSQTIRRNTRKPR